MSDNSKTPKTTAGGNAKACKNAKNEEFSNAGSQVKLREVTSIQSGSPSPTQKVDFSPTLSHLLRGCANHIKQTAQGKTISNRKTSFLNLFPKVLKKTRRSRFSKQEVRMTGVVWGDIASREKFINPRHTYVSCEDFLKPSDSTILVREQNNRVRPSSLKAIDGFVFPKKFFKYIRDNREKVIPLSNSFAIFEIESSLNGSNGEWTNTDDLDREEPVDLNYDVPEAVLLLPERVNVVGQVVAQDEDFLIERHILNDDFNRQNRQQNQPAPDLALLRALEVLSAFRDIAITLISVRVIYCLLCIFFFIVGFCGTYLIITVWWCTFYISLYGMIFYLELVVTSLILWLISFVPFPLNILVSINVYLIIGFFYFLQFLCFAVQVYLFYIYTKFYLSIVKLILVMLPRPPVPIQRVFACYKKIFYYLLIMNISAMQHVISSALNGNNGEWTNTDDVSKFSSKHVRNYENRSNILIEPIKYSERPSGKKKDDICKWFLLNKCTSGLKCRYTHPALSDENTSKQSEQEIVSEKVKPLLYVARVRGVYYDSGVFTKEKDDNWVEDASLSSRYELPSFKFGEVEYKKSSVHIVDSINTYLLSELRFVSYHMRDQNAVSNFIISKFKTMPIQILSDHVTYYLYQCKVIKLSTEDIPSKLVVDICSLHQLSLQVSSYIKIPLAKSNKTPDYKFNNMWELSGNKGFNLTDLSEIDLGTYPSFDTHRDPNDNKFVDWFCKFSPSAGFDHYANTNTNVCLALARYFSARPDEDILNENQLALVTLFPIEFSQDLALQVNATFQWDDESITLSKHGMHIHTDITHTHDIKPATDSLIKLFDNWFIVYLVIMTILALVTEWWSSRYSWLYSSMTGFFCRLDFYATVVDRPAVKKELYQSFFNKEKFFNVIFGNVTCWVSKLKFEIAKFNSYPRLYASAEEYCLLDPIAPEIAKKIFSKSIRLDESFSNTLSSPLFGLNPLGSSLIKFVDAPEFYSSSAFFSDVSIYDSYFAFFSDDGFIKISFRGVTRYFETDISKCDLSQRFAIFSFARYLLSLVFGKYVADRLILQCSKPTRLVNPDNGSEYILLKLVFFILFSGSLLTTFVNNLASFLIMSQIYYDIATLTDEQELTEQTIITAAAKVGYVLTASEKSGLSSVTFLKRSYDGKFSFACLGPLLRSFGLVENFEPKTFGLTRKEYEDKSLGELFEIYCHNRVDQYKNEPGNFVLDKLRIRFKCIPNNPHLQTPKNAYYERYNINDYEMEVLAHDCLTLSLGCVFSNSCLNKIFFVDYGVEIPAPPQFQPPESEEVSSDQSVTSSLSSPFPFL
jgi:hypothetical protein